MGQVLADQFSIAPIVPPRGLLYSHFRAPLILPSSGDAVGLTLTASSPSASFISRFRMPTLIFRRDAPDWRPPHGKRGSRKVVYADYEYQAVLGYFQTVTIHASGVPPSP